MADLIDRQVAIKAISKFCEEECNSTYCGECRVKYPDICIKHPDDKDTINILEELPSAEPEQRWIPCSEETGDGYPEEDGLYYVTEQNYGFYLDADYKQSVAHTSHFKNGGFADRFYTENHSNITAWMPLPEPFLEGGSDMRGENHENDNTDKSK